MSGAQLTRVDLDGKLSWSRIGEAPDRVDASALSFSGDGGIVLAGNGALGNGSGPAIRWIQKLGPDGEPQWGWRFPTWTMQAGVAVLGLSDGGALLAGIDLDEKPVLDRFSPSGKHTWGRRYEISGNCRVGAIALTEDGGILVAGTLDNAPSLMHLDSEGKPIWLRSYTIGAELTSLAVGPNGEIAVSGRRRHTRPGSLVLRLEANGTEGWARGTELEDFFSSCSLLFDSEGRLFAAALHPGDPSRPAELAMTRFRESGDTEWQVTFPLAEKGVFSGPTLPPSAVVGPDRNTVVVTSQFLRNEGKRTWMFDLDTHGALSADCRTEPQPSIPWTTVPVASSLRIVALAEGEEIGEKLDLTWRNREASLNRACPIAPAPVAERKAAPGRPADSPLSEKEEAEGLSDRVNRLIAARDFAALDAEYEGLRARHARFRSGRPMLPAFAEGLLPRAQQLACFGPEGWLDRILEWMHHSPSSEAAPVALARGLDSLAWRARGIGFADSVTEEGWRSFHELARQGWEVLEASWERARGNPNYWLARLQAARSLGLDANERWNSFEAGLFVDPDNRSFVSELVFQMSPQWGGEPEEAELLARTMADRTKDRLGETYYFWIAIETDPIEEPFASSGFEWERVRKGIFDAESHFPGSPESQGMALHFARNCSDRAAARRILGVYSSESAFSFDGTTSNRDQIAKWAALDPVETFLSAAEPLVEKGLFQQWTENFGPRRFAGFGRDWPAMILEASVRTIGGPVGRKGLAFLAHMKGEEPRVVSALATMAGEEIPASLTNPEPIREALLSWSVAPLCPQGNSGLELRTFRPPAGNDFRSFGVLADLPAGSERPPVHSLEVSSEPVGSADLLFLVGRPELRGPNCSPRIELARSAAGEMTKLWPFAISVSPSLAIADFLGSPVLNDRGQVVGVVTGESEEPFAKSGGLWSCESVALLFEKTISAPSSPPDAESRPKRAAVVDVPAPGLAPLASSWPSSLLDDRVIRADGSRAPGAGGFLVRGADGKLFAFVSAAALTEPGDSDPKHPAAEIAAAIGGWELVSLSNLSRSFPASGFRRRPNLRLRPPNDIVILDIDPSFALGLEPLEVSAQPNSLASPSSRFFVAAVDRRSGKASLRFLPVWIGSSGESDFSFDLESPVEPGELLGAPIVDETGRVFGVVAGRPQIFGRPIDAFPSADDRITSLRAGAIASMIEEATSVYPLKGAK